MSSLKRNDSTGSNLCIAFASDNKGTNFSREYAEGLRFVAILATKESPSSLTAAQFTGLWRQHNGKIPVISINTDTRTWMINNKNTGIRVPEQIDIPEQESLTDNTKSMEKISEDDLSSYEEATEKFLYEVRKARGYTVREPSEFRDDPEPRWASDARDWIKFRHSVLKYEIFIENQIKETGYGPTVDSYYKTLKNDFNLVWSIK